MGQRCLSPFFFSARIVSGSESLTAPIPTKHGILMLLKETFSVQMERHNCQCNPTPTRIARDSTTRLNHKVCTPTIALFQDDHFPHWRNLVCFQLVEIDTTRNAFTQRIATIPIRRTTPARVVTRRLMKTIPLS